MEGENLSWKVCWLGLHLLWLRFGRGGEQLGIKPLPKWARIQVGRNKQLLHCTSDMASRSTKKKSQIAPQFSPQAYRQIGNFHFGLYFSRMRQIPSVRPSGCFFEKLMPLALKKMVGMKGPHVLQFLIFFTFDFYQDERKGLFGYSMSWRFLVAFSSSASVVCCTGAAVFLLALGPGGP